jgi:hypothetical protein
MRHARVRADEENRRGEDAEVDLQHVGEGVAQPEVVDEPEHRVVLVAVLALEVLGRREREQRLVVAADVVDRHRRQRDPRQREVDREHGDRHEQHRARDRAQRVAGLLAQVRDRLDPGVREHRDRDREEERAPGRGDAEVHVRLQHRRREHQHEAEQHQQQLGGEVRDGQEDVDPRGLLDADDVHQHQQRDHDDSDDDVPRVLPQRRPEDGQVVRHEERRDGDRGDVVQHLRPGRLERDELVERVPREARGAARLRVVDGALGVGRRREGEDQPGDDEDDRRQPERVDRDDAERVVDRRADVAVGGREQRRRAENPLEPLLAPPA